MYNFDKEAYFTDAKLTYDTRGEIERVADEVSKQGFKNIFFISSGGSLAVMQPIQYLLRSKSSIPSYCEIASEVILTDNKQLNKDSIVITSSKSGTTTETVEAIDFCNKKGIRVIAFCGKADTPVDQKDVYKRQLCILCENLFCRMLSFSQQLYPYAIPAAFCSNTARLKRLQQLKTFLYDSFLCLQELSIFMYRGREESILIEGFNQITADSLVKSRTAGMQLHLSLIHI